MKASHLELPFNNTFLLLVEEVAALGTLPQYKRKGAEYNRFTRARLASKYVQSLIKTDLEIVN